MPPTGPSEDLCLSCGLCCDGSLFWAVPVAEGTPPPAPLDAEGYLRQPCPCFNGACTVYADRPAGCRDFTCHVLDAVTSGEHDRDWALARILAMRQTLAALDAALPGKEPSRYRRVAEFMARHGSDLDNPFFRDCHAASLRAIASYEAALAGFRTLGEPKGGHRI